MEHYLPLLNTVMHIFQSAFLWKIALTFKGMMIHMRAGQLYIMPLSLRFNKLLDMWAH